MGTQKFDSLFNSEDAANYLGYSPQTLKVSRSTGVLSGVEPPQYLKVGRSVRYRLEDLEVWISQFSVYRNTSQY